MKSSGVDRIRQGRWGSAKQTRNEHRADTPALCPLGTPGLQPRMQIRSSAPPWQTLLRGSRLRVPVGSRSGDTPGEVVFGVEHARAAEVGCPDPGGAHFLPPQPWFPLKTRSLRAMSAPQLVRRGRNATGEIPQLATRAVVSRPHPVRRGHWSDRGRALLSQPPCSSSRPPAAPPEAPSEPSWRGSLREK